MQLQYIWIENFKNIKHQGFNFDPKYRFEFKPKFDDEGNIIEGELTVSETDYNLPNDFFGKDIIDVTGIVGKNGSGKSSLLEFITNWIGNYYIKQIIIFRTDDDIIPICHSELKVSSSKLKIKEYAGNGFDNFEKLKAAIIFNAAGISLVDKRNSQAFINSANISTSYFLEKIDERFNKEHKILSAYHQDELHKIADFMETDSFSNLQPILGNTGLDWIHVFPRYSHFDILELKKILRKSDIFNKSLAIPHATSDKVSDKSFLVKLITFSLLVFILKNKYDKVAKKKFFISSEVLAGLNENILTLLKVDKSTDYYNFDIKDILPLFEKDYIHELYLFIQNKKDLFNSSIVDFFDTASKIDSLLNIKFGEDDKFSSSINEFLKDEKQEAFIPFIEFIKSINDSDIKYNNLDSMLFSFEFRISKRILKNFLTLYSRTILNNPFKDGTYLNIQFQGLSGGESSLLNTFARLNQAFDLLNPSKEIKDKYKIKPQKPESYLLLIDEMELYLHPDWIKKFLNILLVNLPLIFDNPIQIIITSHSPFIVSDLPKENIIYLDSYKSEDSDVINKIQKQGYCKVIDSKNKEKTFGQNIHTLLSDSFFMNEGLIGDFAEEKINEILNFYHRVKLEETMKNPTIDKFRQEYSENIEKFKKIQKIIGEPIIANVINNHINEIESIFNNNYNATS